MSSEIEAFLKARYDELEAKARAATPGPWTFDGNPSCVVVAADGRSLAASAWNCEPPTNAANAEHIAANNPRFVLADVASKRLLLDLHKECTAQCYVVRVLAFPFAGHPDFRDEWRTP